MTDDRSATDTYLVTATYEVEIEGGARDGADVWRHARNNGEIVDVEVKKADE